MKLLLKAVAGSLCWLLGACAGGSQSAEPLDSDFVFEGYPMQTDAAVSWWQVLDPKVSQSFQNYGETPMAQELMRRTGIKINFLHPAGSNNYADASVNTAFNVLLASGMMPDIVDYSWTISFPGGPQKAIDDHYIVALNSLIEKDSPNLQAYINDNPNEARNMRTDNGSYYVYPFMRAQESMLISSGPMIRSDWLEDLGLALPETVAEWENVMELFKTQKGAAVPLAPANRLFSWNFLTSPFHTSLLWHLDDAGEIQYGPAEPAFKDFLAMMKKWYDNGWLDKNFTTTDQKMGEAQMLTGQGGITFHSLSGGMGTLLNAARAKGDTRFALQGLKAPVLNKGDKPFMPYAATAFQMGYSAISTRNRYPKLTARLLDYGYGKEGVDLYNYGIDGVSYNWEDGQIKLTDLVLHDPDGLSLANALCKYSRNYLHGPFLQYDFPERLQFPAQRTTLEAWTASMSRDNALPAITPTTDEAGEMSRIMNDITSYMEENRAKFIMGLRSLDQFDAYVAEMEKLGLGRAKEIQKSALARFKTR